MERFAPAPAADPAGLPAIQDSNTHPSNGTEEIMVGVLAELVETDQVSAESNFFDDLGANSLVMAHFCARVRKLENLPSVSMKDVYRHPTIRDLTTAMGQTAAAPAAPEPVQAAKPGSTPQYVLCGVLQFLTFVAYSYLAAYLVVRGAQWVGAGQGLLAEYLRLVLFAGVCLIGLCILPIIAKWVLIGRWKPHQRIRVWSLAYFRFWIVKTLVQRSFVTLLFLGSPLYVLYLKALGAKIGRGVSIFSRNVPACTDLLTVGSGTVIRKDSFLTCYRVEAGEVETGIITIGEEAFVGEMSVIDINVSIGDRAQLGHNSSLHPGQAVPAGERWHGSPAQRSETDYQIAPARCGMPRRALYAVMQLVAVVAVYLPLAIGGVDLLIVMVPQLTALLGTPPLTFTSLTFYRDALGVSFALFFGMTIVGVLFMGTIPRLMNLMIKPDKIYPLYGFHYTLHRAIRVITNLRFFITLFGDSSAIVYYLRYLGYDLSRIEQTGSNFGSIVRHETPFLASVGSGTMIADGLSIMNADFSSTSFRVSRAKIGAHSFLGNNVYYPSQSKTGDNCLLGTKLLVPIDGPHREGIGLLGSPSFEIPRTVARDHQFDHLRRGHELRRGLSAKNRHNAFTMGMFLTARWLHFFELILLSWAVTVLFASLGVSAVALASVVGLAVSVLHFAVVERAVQIIHPLRPLFVSIYDRRFWRHERFWKAAGSGYVQVFNGTPFKSLIWRMLGVRLGRRLFDDGCTVPEKTLVTIGDDCTLNLGTKIQCHSQEDGTFKADRITLGTGCTIGTGALVHYGTTMGDGSVLSADGFLMKGEELPAHERWTGNPARNIREQQYLPA